jgi:hypothetical protein
MGSSPVPGDENGGRRCNLLLNKIWNLLPPFLSNEPGTVSSVYTVPYISLSSNPSGIISQFEYALRPPSYQYCGEYDTSLLVMHVNAQGTVHNAVHSVS